MNLCRSLLNGSRSSVNDDRGTLNTVFTDYLFDPMRQTTSAVPEFHYREATSADVPAMERCRAADVAAGPADTRMAAYLEGEHHPQQALAARAAIVALTGDDVVGYIAAHATTRYGCAGEVQYLYVAPAYRRRGVARQLLRSAARWLQAQGIRRVCVNANLETEGAVPFYVTQGATPLNRYWYVWEDVSALLADED
jgi:GNAT superfamily N-acetyltransferase